MQELRKKIMFVIIDRSFALLVLNIFIICGTFANPVIIPKIVAKNDIIVILVLIIIIFLKYILIKSGIKNS